VLPVLFEGEMLGVIEFASVATFSGLHLTFLERLVATIGVALNTIQANRRTEELLTQSQRLAREMQDQSAELQRTNAELEDKAQLLSEQKANIEMKNREIEMARLGLEEKAQQLTRASAYKTEFLANMSHELRTPLNSLLLLARLLADNSDHNLTEKQIEFARTIHSAGSDLLSLIDDILDLSKIEAGRMDVEPDQVDFDDMRAYVEQAFSPQAEEKGLGFRVDVAPDLPTSIVTDAQRRRHSDIEHLPGAGGHAVRSAVPGRRPAGDRVRGHRHRHRHLGREAGDHLRGVPAGRWHYEPQVRRHRAGPVDQPGLRRPARWHDHGLVPAG
jgi:signal transduction histidine kinase